MPKPEHERFAPLRKGLLEFLILGIVSSGRVYAADILSRLSNTEFATQEGTLYPLLSKLRREQLLDYQWQESTSGPPRKYYLLSDAGRQHYDAFRVYWRELSALIDLVSKPT